MNRLNMYLAVKAFLLSKLGFFTNLPFFTDIFNDFKAFIAAIQAEIGKQSFDPKGLTKTKQELKHKLASITGDNERKIYAYALHFKDNLLMAEMKITQTALDASSDARLKEIAEGIISRATLHLTDLTPYGITAATQLVLRVAIDDFANAIPNGSLNDIELAQSTQKLAAGFKNAELKLEEIKAIAEILRMTEPDVYKAFARATKVTELGTHSIAVRGQVTDLITKEGISKVTIKFLNADGSELQPVILKKSAAKGGFNVKSFAEGIYLVKLTKVGYAEQKLTITVNDGELCKIYVEMIKL